MFRFDKQVYNTLSSFSASLTSMAGAPSLTTYTSLNNQPFMVRTT